MTDELNRLRYRDALKALAQSAVGNRPVPTWALEALFLGEDAPFRRGNVDGVLQALLTVLEFQCLMEATSKSLDFLNLLRLKVQGVGYPQEIVRQLQRRCEHYGDSLDTIRGNLERAVREFEQEICS